MVFLACGLNHKTAPIEIREKLALPNERQNTQLLAKLTDKTSINEAVILSTCNRTEIYCDTDNQEPLVHWLSKQHKIDTLSLKSYLYTHKSHDGIKHAMRVASGLDSMMLGEPQILGQMKKAFRLAEQAGYIGGSLRPIFHHIFSASKRIRSHTALGVNPISIAFASVNLIKRIFTNIQPLNIMLIGSGETSSLVAKYLQDEGADKFLVVNRTLSNARKLSKQLNAESIPIGEITSHLQKADIVISATSCPLPFISKSLVNQALEQRQSKPMFFLDLSVPRDIEQEVHELEHVYLYNIDDLQDLVDTGLSERQDAANQAEQIIEYELDDYVRWHRSLRAKEVLCRYRQTMNTLGDAELDRAVKMLHNGTLTAEQALNELKYRLVNKLIHKPTVGLKRAATDNRKDILDITAYLFKD